MNIIWQDLHFVTNTFANLSVSRSLPLGNGGFCASTSTRFENWVYYPGRIRDIETVKKAVRFFEERDELFVWPVYDGGEDVLKEAGLIYAGDLTAMTFDPAGGVQVNDPAVNIKKAETPEELMKWADCASYSFGEGMPAEEGYRNFAAALSEKRDAVTLYLARYEGEYAGTFFLTNEPEAAGVHYFSVVPEFRRKGIARAMMCEICRLAEGKKVVLQATSMGLKFYRVFGFEELFKIPVYSTESDVF